MFPDLTQLVYLAFVGIGAIALGILLGLFFLVKLVIGLF